LAENLRIFYPILFHFRVDDVEISQHRSVQAVEVLNSILHYLVFVRTPKCDGLADKVIMIRIATVHLIFWKPHACIMF